MDAGWTGQQAGGAAVDPTQLERLLLQIQRHRIALTCLIMGLKADAPEQWPRLIVRILVALLRLQRSNRQATAALGALAPPGSLSDIAGDPATAASQTPRLDLGPELPGGAPEPAP